MDATKKEQKPCPYWGQDKNPIDGHVIKNNCKLMDENSSKPCPMNVYCEVGCTSLEDD